ncbi:MAG: hypothetical protein ACLSVD_04570 [Eggerthellaceae bacterium]
MVLMAEAARLTANQDAGSVLRKRCTPSWASLEDVGRVETWSWRDVGLSFLPKLKEDLRALDGSQRIAW